MCCCLTRERCGCGDLSHVVTVVVIVIVVVVLVVVVDVVDVAVVADIRIWILRMLRRARLKPWRGGGSRYTQR